MALHIAAMVGAMQLPPPAGPPGRRRPGPAGAAPQLQLVLLLSLLSLQPPARAAAPQQDPQQAAAALLADPAVAARLGDPAVAALRSPSLAPRAARALARLDALPPAAAAAAAARTGQSAARLRRGIAQDAASLHLEPGTGHMHYGCALHGDGEDERASDAAWRGSSGGGSEGGTPRPVAADATGGGSSSYSAASAAASQGDGDPDPASAFSLHSRPNAKRVIVLDFDGESREN